MTNKLTAQATAFSAVALLAAGLTMAATETAQAGKTGNFLLGAAAGAAGLAIIGGLAKRRRERVYYSRPVRRYSRPRRYYKPRAVSNPETRRIQEALNILGYNVGAVDGVSGRGTRAGASGFQASINQPATGYLTEMQKGVLFQKAQAMMTGQPVYPNPAMAAPVRMAPAMAAPVPMAPRPMAPAPVAAPGYNPYNAPAQPAAAPPAMAPAMAPPAPAPAYNPYNAPPAPAAPVPAAPAPIR